jgi:aminoglycoside phosphotransferase family enzyme
MTLYLSAALTKVNKSKGNKAKGRRRLFLRGRALDVSIDEKVRFLRTGAAYASCPQVVDVKETHMSWVFVAGDRVYKLKKPVHFPFLDFRTLAARENNCREEVRLNRRLAPDVYLGIVSVTVDENGRLAIAGVGEVVDWLVEMRRLPDELMLDQAILRHRIEHDGSGRLDAVADLLIGFYRASPPIDISPSAHVEQFAREHAINEAVLCDPRFELDGAQVRDVVARVRHGIEDGTLLKNRVMQGHVVEGHGDLRPEHVCLSDPPVIIDCLEFSHALRVVDPFDELIFLTLECELLGSGWVGEHILERCSEGLSDTPAPHLLEFYWNYRACLRARIALAHLLEPNPRTPEKWVPLARRYLQLAQMRAVTPLLRAVP